jgi:hypothetical protein
MPDALVLALIVILAPVGLFVLHAIVSRLVRYGAHGSVAAQTVTVGSIALGNLPLAFVTWELVLKHSTGGLFDALCGFAYVLATYNACCFCYLNVLNVSETSLHVNILMRLLTGGGMKLDDLGKIYGVREMINARIDRMTSLGQLLERDGRYYLNNTTLVRVGRVINAWRRVLRLPLTPE